MEMFHCQEGEEQIHAEEWPYRSEMDSKYTQLYSVTSQGYWVTTLWLWKHAVGTDVY